MRPSEGRISIWPVAVIGLAAMLFALTISPTVKLKSAPPSGFALGASNTTPASEYWNVAVRVIQWKYNRTSALPEQVPAEFRLAENSVHPKIEDHAARAAYWAKLRGEWNKPENWRQTYRLDFSWMVHSAQSVSRVVMRIFDNT
jgi:hypothetical protein